MRNLSTLISASSLMLILSSSVRSFSLKTSFSHTIIKSRTKREFSRIFPSSEIQKPVLFSTASSSLQEQKETSKDEKPPLYLAQGLLAVYKPLGWTSQDVVAYIRGMLERDARDRGADVLRLSKRGNKKKMIKVGHGGTLDPLATGVLVIGIGSGTKGLQDYLSGFKKYKAIGKLGFETNTLDMEGNVTQTIFPDDQSTMNEEKVENILAQFRGKIEQIPPIFSALKSNGRKLYQIARDEGVTDQDMDIPTREVEISGLELLNFIPSQSEQYVPDDDLGEKEALLANTNLSSFEIEVECSGGTYIRSLIRDIGKSLDSCATMTSLIRTKQGPFELDDDSVHILSKEEWSPENIYNAVEQGKERLKKLKMEEKDLE